MTLGALVDAGVDIEALRILIGMLGLPPVTITATKVNRAGTAATHVVVRPSQERTYRPDEMKALVQSARVAERVKERATAAIEALALGEMKAHGTDVAQLHEAGGVDAVVDIVGSMLALEQMAVDKVYCPTVGVGSAGMTSSAHGTIPASPGPAAAHILQAAGFPLRFVDSDKELVTPTGAAILAAIAEPESVELTVRRQGSGAGSRDNPDRPNVVRIFIGEPASSAAEPVTPPAGDTAQAQPEAPLIGSRTVQLLEANLDDMTPAHLSYALNRLLEEGALDAWTEPIGMKKGRPAIKLCALCAEGDEERMANIFLRETTTLGVRVAPYRRFEADRSGATFASTLGSVRVKRSKWRDQERVTVESDDVQRLAKREQRPAIEIQALLERELNS